MAIETGQNIFGDLSESFESRLNFQLPNFNLQLLKFNNLKNLPDYSEYFKNQAENFSKQQDAAIKNQFGDLDASTMQAIKSGSLNELSSRKKSKIAATLGNDAFDTIFETNIKQNRETAERLGIGEKTDWGEIGSASLDVLGSVAGEKLSSLGSRAPKQIATGINAVTTSVNSIKNLKAINAAQAAGELDGVKGVGTAKAGNVMAMVGAAADFAGSFLPDKDEYSGEKGNITETLDTAYDAISDGLMSIPGWGMLAGGIMKAGGFASKGLNSLGGGTDGMCVCAGTKVFTASGKVVNIENLYQEQGIIGWNKTTKEIKPQTIPIIIEPREKECIEIQLKSGHILRCSIDHPILSDNLPKAKNKIINEKRIAIRQWKFRRADELKVGDFVGLANNIDYWGNIHVDNAYVVGLLIGNGSYGKGTSCRLISADPDIWKYLEDNNLGIINHCNDSRHEKYSKEIRTYRIIGGIELMKQLGIAYQTGKNKTLPKNIGEFDKESVCALIAGLFDTDGNILVNKDKGQYSITLYQSNIELLKEVKIQLHKLGIFSTINTRKAAKYQLRNRTINSNESYRLQIHDIRSACLFYKYIPLNVSYKKNNLLEIHNMLKDKSPQEHNDISGAKQCKIISIKYIGVQTVYNLQANNDHTYLANGIITHNTTTDAILGSSFLSLTPISLINGFGGKKADTITKNTEAFSNVGGSYTGTERKVDKALTMSGKKYGLFSSSARKKANRLIAEAKRQQKVVSSISQEAQNRQDLQDYMGDVFANAYNFDLQGGYQQGVSVGRLGTKLERARKILAKGGIIENTTTPLKSSVIKCTVPQIIINLTDPANIIESIIDLTDPDAIEEFEAGGVIKLSNPDNETIINLTNPDNIEELVVFKKGGKVKTDDTGKNWSKEKLQNWIYSDEGTKRLYEIWDNLSENQDEWPNWMKRADEDYIRYIYIDDEHKNKNEKSSHLFGFTDDDDGVIIYPLIQEQNDHTLKYYNSHDEAFGRAIKNNEIIKLPTYKDGELFTQRYKELFNGFRNLQEALNKDEEFSKTYNISSSPFADEYWRNADKAQQKLEEEYNQNKEEQVDSYKKGGKVEEELPETPELEDIGGDANVIPDGALHARLHHMDNEDVTRKGIPVVSEDGVQQAEIEQAEIILRLAVTQKLEEMQRQYEEASDEEKDEIACQAGKLLIDEILYNTVDNTKQLL